MTGEVERVSPWSPVIWPYYSALAVGLAALLLQVVAEMIRHAMQVITPMAPVGSAEPMLPAAVSAPAVTASEPPAPVTSKLPALAGEKT